MNNTTKTIAWSLGIAAAAFVAYTVMKNSKKHHAMTIIKEGYFGGGIDTLMSFDKPFINAWYEAVKKGETYFVYNGLKHNTKGGKSIK